MEKEKEGIAAGNGKSPWLLPLLACIAFVALGLPDALWGVAWPAASASLHLPIDALGVLLVASTAGYLLSSLAAARLLKSMTVGALLTLSCLATALSLIGYATAPRWWMIVCFGLIAGAGAGAIDTGLNTYAAIHFRPRLVNWLHGCYGIGATIGSLMMTAVQSAGWSWRLGYGVIGCWQLLLAGCFGLTLSRWSDSSETADLTNRTGGISSTIPLRIVWLSAAIFFVYTGIEAAVGAWTYSLFTMSRGVDPAIAGLVVGSFWASFTVGRFISGATVVRISAEKLVQACVACLTVCAGLISLDAGNWLTLSATVLIGFAAAPIFPLLIATTPARVGSEHTANAIALQIGSAVLGQSLLPALFGVLARKFGLEIIGPSLLASAMLLLAMLRLLLARGRKKSAVIRFSEPPSDRLWLLDTDEDVAQTSVCIGNGPMDLKEPRR